MKGGVFYILPLYWKKYYTCNDLLISPRSPHKQFANYYLLLLLNIQSCQSLNQFKYLESK